ncbi:MAG: hypothetical protein FWH07_05205 [Oscillospiraceae bacterium]|nr:hypothetical protein [Oscillospiraceae bacterium]
MKINQERNVVNRAGEPKEPVIPTLNTDEKRELAKGDFPVGECGEFLNYNVKSLFDELFQKTKLKKGEVFERANIAASYGYEITGGKKIATRDYYLSLAIAMSLDLSTTMKVLEVAFGGGLYAGEERNFIIRRAIERGYSVQRTNDYLEELGWLPLDTGNI